MTPLNVLDTFAFAENYGDTQVLYQCLRLIDRNARYIFASPGFSALPINLVKALIGKKKFFFYKSNIFFLNLFHFCLGRNTLNAKEIDIFDSVIRWSQAEIKRRLDDGDEGTVPSLNELFAEFLPYIRYVRQNRLSKMKLINLKRMRFLFFLDVPASPARNSFTLSFPTVS